MLGRDLPKPQVGDVRPSLLASRIRKWDVILPFFINLKAED
jgi:hypothetical protein